MNGQACRITKKRSHDETEQENKSQSQLPLYSMNQQYMYPYPPYNPYTYPSPPLPSLPSLPPPPPPPSVPYNYSNVPIKQSPNAFILFSAEVRPKMRSENPDLSIGEISRMVGNAWKNLPENEKNKYYEESKRLREENKELKKLSKIQQKSIQNNKMVPPSLYPNSYGYGYPPPLPGMPSYTSNGVSYSPPGVGEIKAPPHKRTRTPKDPTQPKHPSSAFIFFLHELRPKYSAKYPKKSLGVISKMIASKWKELSQEEKAKYIKKSEDDKKRYLLEMEMWLENNKKQKK